MSEQRFACSEIWVCFEPLQDDPPAHAVVLSFMRPGSEAVLERRCAGRVIGGRALVDEIRAQGRTEYLRLIARLGTSPCLHGRTLRQVLQGPGDFSRWWFLDVTEKDCLWDEDTIYLTILHLRALQAVKARYHVERVHLHGAPRAFAAALGRDRAPGQPLVDLLRAIVFGMTGRFLLFMEYAHTWWTLRRVPISAEARCDVLLQAYWDWTVRPDRNGGLQDRYFTTLPARLAGRNISVGWLASSEPNAEPWQRGRTKREVLTSASEHPDVTLLERYLTLGDIAGGFLNIRYAFRVTRVVASRAFRQLCAVSEFDLYPLVRRQLLRAAWGRTFLRLELVATATARACRQLRPSVVVGAFEVHLRSRALYAGVRSSWPRPQVWAAQHAVYSRDKTFGTMDPEVEFRGAPDGCAMPVPDGIFAMGDLSRGFWTDNGFGGERVVLTGSLRYQGVGITPRAPRARREHVTLLLAGGMSHAAHADLCDAAVAAAAGLPVRLCYRDHPLYRFADGPLFRRFRDSVQLTSGTLDEDFEAADLVLFSQTGIAEEALLRGVPTWQWLWPGCNTSVFLDVPVIPAFSSVASLRRALESFIANPDGYQPSAEAQRRVLHECFGPEPRAASTRVADAIQQLMTANAGACA